MYATLTFEPWITILASGCVSRAMLIVEFSPPNASTAGARRTAARSSSMVPPFHHTTAMQAPRPRSSSAIVLARSGAKTGSCEEAFAKSADFMASAE